ncbi:hypothetical protein Tco_1506846 [Tanacetum coccineum]
MRDENPIRTLGDYSRPSHEGYWNTIELPERNNVVPLRSDTIRLVQNGCSFHGLQSEDPNVVYFYYRNKERRNEYMKALSLASYVMEEITEGKYYPIFPFILSL